MNDDYELNYNGNVGREDFIRRYQKERIFPLWLVIFLVELISVGLIIYGKFPLAQFKQAWGVYWLLFIISGLIALMRSDINDNRSVEYLRSVIITMLAYGIGFVIFIAQIAATAIG